MKRWILIPARKASTRLPDKCSQPILGKPLLQWTYEAACQADVDDIAIAVDDRSLYDLAVSFGAQVVMTRMDHPTGTDRIAEAAKLLGASSEDIVLNLQGDEPLVPKANLTRVMDEIECGDMEMATLCEPIQSLEEALDPNIVKVTRDMNNRALYFSRAPIPWTRGVLPDRMADTLMYRHVGIYAYTGEMLDTYVRLSKSPDEIAEQLEQLRILHHGYRISVVDSPEPTLPGVDTVKDIQRIEAALSAR